MGIHDRREDLFEGWCAIVGKSDMAKEPLYIGIDVGFEGGFGLLRGSHYATMPLPTLTSPTAAKKNRQVFDDGGILALVRRFESLADRSLIRVAYERPTPNGGGKRNFGGEGASRGETPQTAWSVGFAVGMWPLFWKSREISALPAHPGAWKKWAEITHPDAKIRKQKALDKAGQLFPGAWYGARGRDHNMAESMLLAWYARDQLFKSKEEKCSTRKESKRKPADGPTLFSMDDPDSV